MIEQGKVTTTYPDGSTRVDPPYTASELLAIHRRSGKKMATTTRKKTAKKTAAKTTATKTKTERYPEEQAFPGVAPGVKQTKARAAQNKLYTANQQKLFQAVGDLVAEGVKHSEIAERLGVNPARVYNTMCELTYAGSEPQTAKAVVRSRDAGDSWDIVAAKTSLSMTQAKKLYEEETGSASPSLHTRADKPAKATAKKATKKAAPRTKAKTLFTPKTSQGDINDAVSGKTITTADGKTIEVNAVVKFGTSKTKGRMVQLETAEGKKVAVPVGSIVSAE